MEPVNERCRCGKPTLLCLSDYPGEEKDYGRPHWLVIRASDRVGKMEYFCSAECLKTQADKVEAL